MSSIFTKIINKELPSTIIEENDDYICIKDINPRKKIHWLAIPKQEVENLTDLSQEEIGALFQFATEVAEKNKLKSYILGINVHAPYQEVPHLHVHIMTDYPSKQK